VEEVRKRQKNLGPDTIRFAWVKAHVRTSSNERADQMAKLGAELEDEDEGMNKVIMERRSRKGEEQRRGRSRGQEWEE